MAHTDPIPPRDRAEDSLYTTSRHLRAALDRAEETEDRATLTASLEDVERSISRMAHARRTVR